MCLFMVGLRIIYINLPLEMDSATYAIIANGILDGGNLYSEYWDIKPPLIFILYAIAQLIAGFGNEHIFILSSVAAIATLLGVYFAAKNGLGGKKTGIIAALIWTTISADRVIQANYPNTEVFINCLLVWAFALTLYARQRTPNTKHFIVIGVLFAAASLFKHTSAVTAAIIMGGYLYTNISSKHIYASIKNITVVSLIGLLSWATLFAYFYYHQRFPEAWDALIIFNQEYAGNLSKNITSLINPATLFPLHIFKFNILLVLTSVTGVFLVNWKRPSDRVLLLLSYLAGSAIAIALPGKFHAHYYQLWLPALCIASSWVLAKVETKTNWPRIEFTSSLLIAVLLSQQILQVFMPTYKVPEIGPRLAYNYNIAKTIDDILGPGESFLQWGHNVELYYYTRRTPPVGELRSGLIHKGSLGEKRVNNALNALKNAPPKLVVVARGWNLKHSHPIESWIINNYILIDPDLPPQLPNIGMKFYSLDNKVSPL